MVFDLGAGLYWRLEEDGLLFGSATRRSAGRGPRDRLAVLRAHARPPGSLVPVTRGLGIRRIWAATIDFTPDHLPILGPGAAAGRQRVDGLTVASAGGHGMMWGPAVARIAADLALRGRTDIVDIHDLGLDRFDADGRSRLAPIPSRCRFRSLPARRPRQELRDGWLVDVVETVAEPLPRTTICWPGRRVAPRRAPQRGSYRGPICPSSGRRSRRTAAGNTGTTVQAGGCNEGPVRSRRAVRS